jgi:prepilin-type N-terminal cleavage/methylation domain-containing protein
MPVEDLPETGIMSQPNPTTSRQGFTLVELLVVTAIIIVLALFSFVGLRKLMLTAHKTESLNNIRALSSLSIASATDNNGNFPEIHSPANSTAPYWFSREFREEHELTRAQCYSSANRCWKRTGMDICNPRDLWDWADGVSSVWGYVCLVNDNGWADSGDFVQPDNWASIRQQVSVGRNVRWVPEKIGQDVAYPILWMDLTRIWNGGIVGNFMKDDTKPLGTHVGYLDGHIEWVRGDDMKERFRGSATLLW